MAKLQIFAYQIIQFLSVNKFTFIILTTGISFALISIQINETATVAVSACERNFLERQKASVSICLQALFYCICLPMRQQFSSKFDNWEVLHNAGKKSQKGTGSSRDHCKMGKLFFQRQLVSRNPSKTNFHLSFSRKKLSSIRHMHHRKKSLFYLSLSLSLSLPSLSSESVRICPTVFSHIYTL